MSCSSNIVGPKLLKMFGIDDNNVRSFEIRAVANECITINVEYIGDYNHDTFELETAIKTFNLVEKEDE